METGGKNEVTQSLVLQCLTNYTKHFLRRLENPDADLDRKDHKPSLMSNASGRVKPETVQLKPRSRQEASHHAEQGLYSPRGAKAHVFNPCIDFEKVETEQTALNGKQNENLESILQIGKKTIRPEELIRVFDKDVVRSGKSHSNIVLKFLKENIHIQFHNV